MKKTLTLLLLSAVLCLQTFAAKPDFKKFREAVRKSLHAQPADNNNASRATQSRKVARVYYDNGTLLDSTHYIYNNNYAPYGENDLVADFFLDGESKYDSAINYDNGLVDYTDKLNYTNQKLTSYISRSGNNIYRYSLGYDAQGRFNGYSYDTLTSFGIWDRQGKEDITYNIAGNIDSFNSYIYIGGNYIARYRSVYTYTPANLFSDEESYEYSFGQWVLSSKYRYAYNVSGKQTLRVGYNENNSVFGISDSTLTTYPQANVVLETRFYFTADTVSGGSRDKTILNGLDKPLYNIYQESYDATTKQWEPATYYDQNTQQFIPKDDTTDIYTYNSYNQQLFQYYETNLLRYDRNYYEEYSAVSGIAAYTSPLSVGIYPNPANDVLNIRLNEQPEGGLTISIYNPSGQLVQQANRYAQQYTSVDINQLPAGIYALLVDADGKRFSSKFLKNK